MGLDAMLRIFRRAGTLDQGTAKENGDEDMANYVHKTGYVVYNQDKDAYISGYGYGGSGTKVTYYDVQIETAKVWLTSKGARAACLPHEVPVHVKLDAKGHAMRGN